MLTLESLREPLEERRPPVRQPQRKRGKNSSELSKAVTNTESSRSAAFGDIPLLRRRRLLLAALRVWELKHRVIRQSN
jgi:hypothetical protein